MAAVIAASVVGSGMLLLGSNWRISETTMKSPVALAFSMIGARSRS
jgi:hypothetical protein